MDTRRPSETVASDAVKAFRARTGGKPPRKARWAGITRRERAIGAGLLAQLVFLYFWVGGWLLWTHMVATVLAIGTWLLLFMPMGDEMQEPVKYHPRGNVRRLLRFPPFWTGALLLFYILIQGLNPAWDYRWYGAYGAIHARDHIEWLPSGLNAPLEESNPFRIFILFLGPWLFVCSLWLGIHSRRMLVYLLGAVVALSVVWTCVSLYQFYTGAERILGVWESVRTKLNYRVPFWGTLVNDNHAAYFMTACAGLALALFLHFLRNGLARFRPMGPYYFFLFAGVLFTFQVFLTQSRGGMIAIIVLWLLFCVTSVCVVLRYSRRMAAAFAAPLLLAFVGIAYVAITNPRIWTQVESNITATQKLLQDPRSEGRYFLNPITYKMWEEKRWLGWGAGSFRYFFRLFRKDYPELNPRVSEKYWDEASQRYRWRSLPVQFNQAHNDWLEFLYELGIAGYIPLLASVAFFPLVALFHLRSWSGAIIMLYGGSGLVLAAALIGFHMRMPVIHLLYALLWVSAAKWVVLQTERRKAVAAGAAV